MADDRKKFMVEGARILFRNFTGKAGQYNREGDRNFAVVLDSEDAAQLERDGWNVKYLAPRDEGDIPTPYIPVTVKYAHKPPRIVMITSTGRKTVTEEMVSALDGMDFANVDLLCTGYEWDINGKQGITAYLQSMFVTIEEDELERKYARMEMEGRV